MTAIHRSNFILCAISTIATGVSSTRVPFSAFMSNAKRQSSPKCRPIHQSSTKILLPFPSLQSKKKDEDTENYINSNGRFPQTYNEIFLIAMEGTLASTSRSRSIMSICAALKVWPSLQSSMETLGMNPADFDWENVTNQRQNDEKNEETYNWLLQKMEALSSVAQQGNDPDTLLGVDSVLLARLLIEEQLLDGGRSNGCDGKYGGKFHPSSSASGDDEGEDETSGSKVGSRPLTVGELFANWHELKLVTRNKYPAIVDGKAKDPLPEIRSALKEMFSLTGLLNMKMSPETKLLKDKILASWFPIAYDAIFDYQNDMNVRQNMMILLGHESQLSWALSSLSLLDFSLDIESDLEEECKYVDVNTTSNGNTKVLLTSTKNAWRHQLQRLSDDDPSLLLVVPDSNIDQSHSNAIHQIVMDSSRENIASDVTNNICVVHSSLDVLKECKSFVGDDVPMLSHGIRKSKLPHDDVRSTVTFFLSDWCNVHPSQCNYAEMDPWLNVLSEEEFLELISAKIVQAPYVEAV